MTICTKHSYGGPKECPYCALTEATALLARIDPVLEALRCCDWSGDAYGPDRAQLEEVGRAFVEFEASRAPAQPTAPTPTPTPEPHQGTHWASECKDPTACKAERILARVLAAPEPSAPGLMPLTPREHWMAQKANDEHQARLTAEAQLAAVNEVAQRAEKRVGLYPGLKGSTYYAAYLEILALLVRGATPATSPGAKEGEL